LIPRRGHLRGCREKEARGLPQLKATVGTSDGFLHALLHTQEKTLSVCEGGGNETKKEQKESDDIPGRKPQSVKRKEFQATSQREPSPEESLEPTLSRTGLGKASPYTDKGETLAVQTEKGPPHLMKKKKAVKRNKKTSKKQNWTPITLVLEAVWE